MSTIDTIKTEYLSDDRNSRSTLHSMPGTITVLNRWFSTAMMKRRTRIHLSELNDSLLEDIGIGPAEARREVKRFFWD